MMSIVPPLTKVRDARPTKGRALSQWKDLTAPRPVQRSGEIVAGV
jgi:dihydropyrimidinase